MFSHMPSSQHLATAIGIPQYSGSPSEDVELWIRTFSLNARAKNYSEDDKKLSIQCLLTGAAKIFYNICRGDEIMVDSMLELLRKRFYDDSVEKMQQDIESLKKDPSTTWCEFIESYVELARRCHTPESVMARWILRRLPDSAVILLSTLKLAGYDIPVEAILDCLRSTSMKNVLKEWTTQPNALAISTPKKRKPRKRDKWCRMHGKCAHTSEECLGINKSSSSYSTPNLFAVRNFTNQFVKWLKFPSTEIQALIDTGANISCIKSSIAASLNLTENKNETIVTADGRKATGKWTERVNFKVMDCNCSIEFLALPNLSYDIILGMDVLKDLISRVGASAVFSNYSGISSVNSVLSDFESVMSDEITGTSATKLQEFRINTGD